MKPTPHACEQHLQQAIEKGLQDIEQSKFESLTLEATERRIKEFHRRTKPTK